jgi:LysM repeat protein
MKKLFMLPVSLVCLLQICFSQNLYVQGEKGSLFLIHKVVPKENWYSVGRLYNISPKEIAPFNNSSLTMPLGVGQQLKIPLTETNFSQNSEKNADESLVPVYHTLQANESLNKISSNYNAVPLHTLEAWNNVKKENMKAGMHLIVGYLRVKTSLSALAAGAKNVSPVAMNTEKTNDETIVAAPKEIKKSTSDSEKKQLPSDVGNSATSENKISALGSAASFHSNAGGFFIGEYNEGTKSKNGTAGTFKSTSGWQDGKYYALMNNVQVGTIIKVIAPATQKSIYAKVLGQLPDMKESEGLTIRISNAAASELGEPEGKFGVQIRY